MSTWLGEAILQLDANAEPLYRKLKEAEARTAAEGAAFDAITKKMGVQTGENLRGIGTAAEQGVSQPIARSGLDMERITKTATRSLETLRGEAAKVHQEQQARDFADATAKEKLLALEKNLTEARRVASASEARANRAGQPFTPQGIADYQNRVDTLRRVAPHFEGPEDNRRVVISPEGPLQRGERHIPFEERPFKEQLVLQAYARDNERALAALNAERGKQKTRGQDIYNQFLADKQMVSDLEQLIGETREMGEAHAALARNIGDSDRLLARHLHLTRQAITQGVPPGEMAAALRDSKALLSHLREMQKFEGAAGRELTERFNAIDELLKDEGGGLDFLAALETTRQQRTRRRSQAGLKDFLGDKPASYSQGVQIGHTQGSSSGSGVYYLPPGGTNAGSPITKGEFTKQMERLRAMAGGGRWDAPLAAPNDPATPRDRERLQRTLTDLDRAMRAITPSQRSVQATYGIPGFAALFPEGVRGGKITRANPMPTASRSGQMSGYTQTEDAFSKLVTDEQKTSAAGTGQGFARVKVEGFGDAALGQLGALMRESIADPLVRRLDALLAQGAGPDRRGGSIGDAPNSQVEEVMRVHERLHSIKGMYDPAFNQEWDQSYGKPQRQRGGFMSSAEREVQRIYDTTPRDQGYQLMPTEEVLDRLYSGHPLADAMMGGGGGGRGRRPTLLGGAGGEDPWGAASLGIGRRILTGKGHHRRPPGWAGYLLGPLFGAATVGSIGSFAGFGTEHALTTLGGFVGSGVAGAAGAGLEATGALGNMLVGGGSDMLVMKSTISQTHTLSEAYAKVRKAVMSFGAGSKQAVKAQAELNGLMKEMGEGPGTKAEAMLAKQTYNLKQLWNTQTQGARAAAVTVLEQFVHVAHDYIPLVASAAKQNFGIMNEGLKPFTSWLRGPEGMGIFRTLETQFATNLPHAVHAFDQGMELLLKTMAYMSKDTGGLTMKLDAFLTRANSPTGFAKWSSEMDRLVRSTHEWSRFLKVLWADIRDAFKQDSETGRGIVLTLTAMLERLHEWETSTKGSGAIHNLFAVHKEQVLELLKVLPALASGFGSIYLTLAPPMVKLVTGLARGLASVLESINKMGPVARDMVGAILVMAKIGLLKPLLKAVWGDAVGGLGRFFGLQKEQADYTQSGYRAAQLQGAEGMNALASATARASQEQLQLFETQQMVAKGNAESRLASLPVVGGTIGKLQSPGGMDKLKTSLLRAGTYGLGGLFAGEMAGSVLGLHGTDKHALGLAGAGAGIGQALFGVTKLMGVAGPWGAAAGAAIGLAAPYVGKLIGEAFGGHVNEHAGHYFAKGALGGGASMFNTRTQAEYEKRLENDRKATLHYREKLKEDQAIRIDPLTGKQVYAAAPKQRAADFNQMFNAEYREGKQTAGVSIGEFAGVSKKTTTMFVSDVLKPLHQLSGEAQQEAARSMILYGEQLERHGHLPKGAMKKILDSIKQQFPGLDSYIGKQGLASAESVARSFKLDRAKANLAESLNSIKGEWGLFNLDKEVNGSNWVSNMGKAMDDLKRIVATSTGDTKKEAEKHLSELVHKSDGYFKSLAHNTDASMKQQAVNIRAHTPGAIQQVESEYSSFVGQILKAEEAGTMGVAEGSTLMGRALKTMLTALGAKDAIVIPQIDGHLKVGNAPGHLHRVMAQGGLTQVGSAGEAGYDSVPMNVGGQQIVVAPGEQVAVFNRHQLPEVNAALHERGYAGGLPGLFQAVQTPHYMAKGGLLGMEREADRINAAHYPYVWGGGHGGFQGPYDCSGAVSAVLHAGGVLSAPRVSGDFMNYGQPGPGEVTLYANSDHVYMSLMGHFFGTHGSSGAGWFAGGPRPGFAVRHVPDGLLGEGLGEVPIPKVKGSGAVADGERAALRRIGHAARALVKKEERKLMSGVFGGGDKAEGRGAPGSSAQMRSWAKAGLEAAGMPATPANMRAVLYVMQHESGGNPMSENTWDSNARAGHPSRGLMELTPENFSQYRVGKLPNNVFNPVANVAASVRYMLGRYGHIVEMSPYAKGGIVGKAARRIGGGADYSSLPRSQYGKFVNWVQKHYKSWGRPGQEMAPEIWNKLIFGFLGKPMGYAAYDAENLPRNLQAGGKWNSWWEHGDHYSQGGCPTCGSPMCQGGMMCGGGMIHAASGYYSGGGEHGKARTARIKPKTAIKTRIHHKKAGRKLSPGNLILDMAQIPAMKMPIDELSRADNIFNRLGSELELLGGYSSNPAQILGSDMGLIGPMMFGEDIHPGMTAPSAEVKNELAQRAAGGENPDLAYQMEVLQWISGLDSHRLLRPQDIKVLAHTWASEPKLNLGRGLVLNAGEGVHQSEERILQQQMLWMKPTEWVLNRQLTVAKEQIALRKKRAERIRHLLHVTAKRMNSLKATLANLKLKGAKQHYNEQLTLKEAREHRAAINESLEIERHLPKGERNEKLIASLISTREGVNTFETKVTGVSKLPVISAEIQKQIHPLEDTMDRLGGATTRIGAGGQLHQVLMQLKRLENGVGSVRTRLETVKTETRPQTEQKLQTLQDEIRLATEREQLTPVRPKASSETQSQLQLGEMAKQQLQEKSLALAASQAQYKVLANLPAFGGHFAMGGYVPGPVGSPKVIIAHGGEKVLRPDQQQQAPHVSVHVADGMSWLGKFIDVRVNGQSRRTAGRVARPLPGAGGGSR